MSNLRRRLHKLEALLIDDNGMIPNTQRWFDFWTVKAARIIVGEEDGKIPFAFIDALHAESESSAILAQDGSDSPGVHRKLCDDQDELFAKLARICSDPDD
jgi:hypothetical protein